jgi:hypothetical protein
MDLKQILSLHLDGYSNRKIGRTLGLSRNTINGYLKLFMSCEIPINLLIRPSKSYGSFSHLTVRSIIADSRL